MNGVMRRQREYTLRELGYSHRLMLLYYLALLLGIPVVTLALGFRLGEGFIRQSRCQVYVVGFAGIKAWA